MKFTSSICFLFLFSTRVLAQDQVKLDSLTIQLDRASEDTVKVDLYLQISKLYAGNNLSKAEDFAMKVMELSQKNSVPNFVAI